ncbi:hypothetical protein LEP1GSC193_0563 [Leptospira alstonii serovar Pingchang str. 80-412]|uniref:Uncharacterized protein n=1 Tax=Leptospira alstonii serovar Pingchang str. 80-412 TaxID=1218564 RepID=T0FP27_9LEPT|nr:hypothetical protein LEP1GSC193_0563 [Leptospira alstonii serovar Pingchang str. 80-412]
MNLTVEGSGESGLDGRTALSAIVNKLYERNIIRYIAFSFNLL